MKVLTPIVLLAGIFLVITVNAAEPFPVYNLSVSFDTKKNLLRGSSTIIFPEERKVDITTGDLTVLSVKLNGQPLDQKMKDGKIKVVLKGTLEIVFEGTFREKYEKEAFKETGLTKKFIGDEGICLTGGWFPSIGGVSLYILKAVLPGGFVAVSEADEVKVSGNEKSREYSFVFPHPVTGITLIAGKYTEMKETFNGIDIYGYFFPGDRSFAKTYFELTKRYLGMYEKLLTPYPYKRFSIVESFLPAGESMPTIMLLGSEVMRAGFIAETSLGHGILHQWFGSLVYVDYPKGDWSGGLTAYLSDHLYEEQKGTGWQERKNLMVDYENYVNPEKEFPLRNFISHGDFSSGAIGYGKGAMLFHMLKNLTGEDTFYQALKEFIKEKQFREASWDDLKTAFETASGKNLEWFFSQWLARKGIPSIEIRDPKVVVLKGIQTVSFEVIQKGEPFKFDLALQTRTDEGESTEILKIEKERERFEIPVCGNTVELVFDGNYDLMRRLSPEEYPPVVSRLLGDEKRIVVIPEEEGDIYGDLVDVLKGKGFVLMAESEIRDEDIKKNSLLVPGVESPVLKRLFGVVKRPDSGFTLAVKKNPLNTSKVIAVAYADSREDVLPAAESLFRYGRYSLIRFKRGRNIEKDTAETEKGIRVGLHELVIGIQPQKTIKLDEIILKILDKPVIYVGERHTNYEDHKVQLKVIMSLHENGRKFAIGMEMFQKSFQKAINDYLSGTINEKEFLKITQYFRRWQYDYNQYREIIEYARAKNIPVIALNIWAEIVKRVAADGLDALTDLEKAEIPADMDMSDEDYRERLEEIFESHKELGSRDFNNFYQAQILWDETMAHSIDAFLNRNPDYQMVVLAGAGHIVYGSGIPKRAFRLNGKEYVTLVPGTGVPNEDSGDFVLFPEHISPPNTIKLGVVLKKMNGKVQILEIQPASIGEKAGIEKDDIIISVDDWKIEDVDDLRIYMFDKKQGEKMTIKVLRKKFLLGYRELEFNITL